jgi:hypothetical protein
VDNQQKKTSKHENKKEMCQALINKKNPEAFSDKSRKSMILIP